MSLILIQSICPNSFFMWLWEIFLWFSCDYAKSYMIFMWLCESIYDFHVIMQNLIGFSWDYLKSFMNFIWLWEFFYDFQSFLCVEKLFEMQMIEQRKIPIDLSWESFLKARLEVLQRSLGIMGTHLRPSWNPSNMTALLERELKWGCQKSLTYDSAVSLWCSRRFRGHPKMAGDALGQLRLIAAVFAAWCPNSFQ